MSAVCKHDPPHAPPDIAQECMCDGPPEWVCGGTCCDEPNCAVRWDCARCHEPTLTG